MLGLSRAANSLLSSDHARYSHYSLLSAGHNFEKMLDDLNEHLKSLLWFSLMMETWSLLNLGSMLD